jgi:hypothetical protein
MKLFLPTLGLALLLLLADKVARGDDATATPARSDDTATPAATEGTSAATPTPTTDETPRTATTEKPASEPATGTDGPAKEEPVQVLTATAPQINPEMATAIAQAAKILAQQQGDSGANPAKLDPETEAAMAQALKLLGQAQGEAATATTNSAPVVVGEKLVKDAAGKDDDRAAKAEAEAELEQAQQLAEAAMTQASQAAAQVSGSTTSDPLSTEDQSAEVHNSMNGLIMSAHSLDPDCDSTHHSMDSLF